MKILHIASAFLIILGVTSCSKEELPAEPPMSELTTGCWRVTGVQYSIDRLGTFLTATGIEGTVTGSVNFTIDSIFHNVNAGAIVTDSIGKTPIPSFINDSRYGNYTILNDDQFNMIDAQSLNTITYEGLARSENAMHLTYVLKTLFPIGMNLDSFLPINETYTLKLER